jgi:hypothetical protein
MTIILVIRDQDDLYNDLGASRSGGAGGLTHSINSRGGHSSSTHIQPQSIGSGIRRF